MLSEMALSLRLIWAIIMLSNQKFWQRLLWSVQVWSLYIQPIYEVLSNAQPANNTVTFSGAAQKSYIFDAADLQSVPYFLSVVDKQNELEISS